MDQNKCTVVMDGEVRESTDFVAVLAAEDGGASITYDTDAITLGMALKMVARAFVETMYQCDPEERAAISNVLGDAFIEEAKKSAEEAEVA